MQWLILAEGLPVGAWKERIAYLVNASYSPRSQKKPSGMLS